ncbi:hypothetical protein D1007_55101 [Hordeum vulgare]|nr:hypothetical protein D1007_55101 [Hordeum vulgare]
MCLKDANPRLEEPKELREKTSAWRSAKLSDPRVVPVLERISHDIGTKRLTGGMLLKEFLVPLEAHSKPLDVVSSGDKKEEDGRQPKATPDAPPALVGASLSAGGEEEARGVVSLALIVEPPEP